MVKGQITKHEWGQTRFAWRKICPHCNVERISSVRKGGGYQYIKSDGAHSGQEPPCITRKTDTNGEDSNKA